MPLLEGYSDEPILIELGSLDPQPAAMMRCEASPTVIERYASDPIYPNLPPILVVIGDGGEHWISDGHYRYRAAQSRREEAVPCLWRKGAFVDACRDAARANESHGQYPTDDDKKARVLAVLRHPLMGGAGWSQHMIAEVVNVDHSYVSRLDDRRRVLTVDSQQSTPPTIGRDGRTYTKRETAEEKYARIKVQLEADADRSNAEIAEVCGVDRGTVIKCRAAMGLPASQAKARRRHEPAPRLPLEMPSAPQPVARAEESPADEPFVNGMDEEERLMPRWQECRDKIVAMFDSFPVHGRTMFLSKLYTTYYMLLKRCPNIEDLTDHSNS